MKIITAIIFSLLAVSVVSAISVERTVLVAREAGNFAGNIRAALNTRTNKTLVIWQKHRGDQENHSIWGRSLQADGTPSGAAFPIVNGPNAQSPDIAFNPDTNQFLLTYSNEIGLSNRFAVFVQRLNSSGRRSGAPVRVTLASDLTANVMNYFSRVLYDSVSKGYFILLTRYVISGNLGIEEGLHGAVLNSNLTFRKSLVLMSPIVKEGSSIVGPTVSDVKFHSPSGKILIAGYTITTTGGFGFQYFIAKVDPSLHVPRVNLMRLKNGLSSSAAPDVNLMLLPDGNATALFVEGTGLRKRKINQLGAPIGPVNFFYSDSLQNIPVEFPVSAVARNENRSEVAVVSIEDSTMMTGRIWLQTANSTGALTSGSFSLQSNLDTNGRPAIVALPTNLPAGFLYAVIYMEGGQVFLPSPTASSGLALLKVNTTP